MANRHLRCIVASISLYLIIAGGQTVAQEVVRPVDVVMTNDKRVEAPLTSQAPDPFRGLQIFANRRLGNCVACHTNSDAAGMQFLGKIGPNLDWVGDRYSEAELRAIVVDAKVVFGSDSVMPAFYTARPLFRVLAALKDKPILTALQVEDVVAYLASLSQESGFDGVD